MGYDPAASSSAHNLGAFSRIPYIAGDDVAGFAYSDLFAGPSLAWNQTFLSANESSWRWITADGFLGLAFASIAETATNTLVETLLQQRALDQPRFAIYYGKNLNDTGAQDGVLTVGGSHEETYVDAAQEGGLKWVALRKEDPYEVWRTRLRSVTVSVDAAPNSTHTTLPANSTAAAVFDTGAGRVSLPPELIRDVYAALGWSYDALVAGTQRMGCADLNASWAVTLSLGEEDVGFSLRGDEFTTPGAQCMPPLDDSGVQGFALVGAAFIKRHYSVWDLGGEGAGSFAPRIGFGRLRREYDWLYQ